MSQIYINTRQNEETRVIVVENGKLTGYEQELPGQENKKGNIYKGVVTRLQESLEAAFVDLGDEKNGFLPYRELPDGAGELKVGDSVLVQIKKDHVGGKGAGLTGHISLAGCYLVLQPTRSNRAMISKHGDRDMRAQMQSIVEALPVPENMGVILRTAGLGRAEEELRWDLDSYLLKLWELIDAAHRQTSNEPLLIYGENNLPLRVVRDYFRPSRDDLIVCDNLEIFKELKQFIAIMFPNCEDKIRYHDSDEDMVPGVVEVQIDHIFEREVVAKSGVRVVFDSTEALVAIDVNSGSSAGGGDIEETALTTNMEAAELIALHLRLRNLAGLIVVDFIDMEKERNRHQVERHFSQLLRKDRARIRHTRISEFGLVEVSRQRISRSVVSSQQVPCMQCEGTGVAWRPETFAIRLLRKIRVLASDDSIVAMLIQAPAQTAVYLLNEKRIEIRKIEDACNCDILIAPNERMHPPQYNVKTIKGGARIEDSYKIVLQREDEKLEELRAQLDMRHHQPQKSPLLKTMVPEKPAPHKKNGIIQRICKTLFAAGTKKPAQGKPAGGGGSGSRPTDGRSADSKPANGRRNGRSEERRPRRGGESESARRGGSGGGNYGGGRGGGGGRPPRQGQSRQEGGRDFGRDGGRDGGRSGGPQRTRREPSARHQSDAPRQGNEQHHGEAMESNARQDAPSSQHSPQNEHPNAPRQANEHRGEQQRDHREHREPREHRRSEGTENSERQQGAGNPQHDAPAPAPRSAPRRQSVPGLAPRRSAPAPAPQAIPPAPPTPPPQAPKAAASRNENGNTPAAQKPANGGKADGGKGDLSPAKSGDTPPTSGWIDTKSD